MPRAVSSRYRRRRESRAPSLVPRRVSRVRPLSFLLGFAMSCATATPAVGMTLGDITEQSQLGQPLRIVIPVSSQSPEELLPECVKIGPSRAESIDDVAEMSSAAVALEGAGASARLVVTTRRAVNDPVVRITLHAGCEDGFRRGYLMLLCPPVVQTP